MQTKLILVISGASRGMKYLSTGKKKNIKLVYGARILEYLRLSMCGVQI